MPKFFADADDFFSSSEEESDFDDEPEIPQQDHFSSDDETEEEAAEPEPVRAPTTGTGRRWLREGLSSDDETEQKRTVRSQKDKLYDQLEGTIKKMRNHMKINDWVSLHTDFNKLTQQIEKGKKVIDKDGLPQFLIKMLVELEDFSNRIHGSKDQKKSMSSRNYKSMNTMRQKLRKYNKQYAKQIEEYRKAPEEGEQEVPSDDEGEDKAESEDWLSDEEEESEKKAQPRGRSFWLRKDDDESSSEEDEDFFSDDEAPKKKKRGKKKRKGGKKKATDDRAKPKESDKPKEIEWTEELVDKKLEELLAQRGRRGYDRKAQPKKIEALLIKSKSVRQTADLFLAIIAAYFDVNPNLHTYMPIDIWKSAYEYTRKLMKLLDTNRNVSLVPTEDQIAARAKKNAEGIYVVGDIFTIYNKLDTEFTKSLQQIDPHTNDYVNRLADESHLILLAEKVQKYLARQNEYRNMARIALARLQHLYYKSASFIEKADKVISDREHAQEIERLKEEAELQAKIKADQAKQSSAGEKENKNSNIPDATAAAATDTVVSIAPDDIPKRKTITADGVTKLFTKLSSLIYEYGDERLKARAVLCMIFHHALHNRFYEARDLLLMSHLQETIQHMDIPTQILFNRTMVQMGLCAFRTGMISECLSCLSDFYAAGRVKELLAQGLMANRYGDRNPEQEKIEKRRQVPYHMHINLEMLECAHLICALLHEVPNMAFHKIDPKKKIISRYFRRLLEYYDRQDFAGPPENNRDHIIVASKALGKGDWQTCTKLLLSLPFWRLVADADNVKSLITTKIKEEGLRTYLFNFSSHYESLSLKQLSDIFELTTNTVHSIVSKMMINEELHASWDQPTNTILLHGSEPTHLQQLALQFSDKVSTFVESTERESSRGFGYSDSRQEGGKKWDRRQDNRRDNRRQDNRRQDNRRQDNRRQDNRRQDNRRDNRRQDRRRQGNRQFGGNRSNYRDSGRRGYR